MAIRKAVTIGLWLFFAVSCRAAAKTPDCYNVKSPSFNRSCFPKHFLFGTASASYQVEGAWNEGGRSPSIWDTFTHKFPARNNFNTGDVAADFYHRYKDDIKLMKELNSDVFRMSISWSRILPRGGSHKNMEGIKFYKSVINELVKNGLQVSVTLFHWDLPQVLEDKYGGFLSRRVVKDYRKFAKICFQEFGDKVKFWATFNEPKVYSVAGYDRGIKAPGRCSKFVNPECEAGNSATEPYIVSHNILLAHAAGVQEFRKCKKCQSIKAKIGMAHSPVWYVPYSNTPADKEAAQRVLDFEYGWHMHPMTYGDYPESMKKILGKRLPRFSHSESRKLKNSYDYVGINYYSTNYAADLKNVDPTKPRYTTDAHADRRTEKNGVPIGPTAASANVVVYPKGMREIVKYTKDRYKNPVMYITENGYSDVNNQTLPLKEALRDKGRKDYVQRHLVSLLKAIKEDGANVKGYFAWALTDNLEWQLGYSVRFGLYFVDFQDNLKRYPKESAKWYSKFLAKN
ncbi:PREDICTED: beta-glucosidase 32-like [Tarenaya hassleriana]|uniref:beta-glucosidase 32-like n=1 Tax=Tarenaya hassleriana TaxID=28532 RepID=UPI00053C7D08|nr:PREDICTED: beta-glucosidase 32-like [Tarenaya hassleriana]